MDHRTYSIGELSAEFGVTTRTIRFYEEKGFLTPRRNGQQRIYSAADRTRLRLILRGKRLGFTLDESASIIDMYGTPGGSRRQLERLVGRIREKQQALVNQMADLQLMQQDLADAEHRCEQALQAFDSEEADT